MEKGMVAKMRNIDLQDWQKAILKEDEKTFELKPQQKDMIEKLLFPSDSNPYWVEEEYKRILLRVLTWGYYKEEDREALNYARECYLRGKNWVK
jgi:hypothetical protein